MKARWSLLPLLALGLTALPAGAQQQPSQQQPSQQQPSLEERHEAGREQNVKLNELPKPAQQTIQSNLGGGKIKQIEKVTLPDGQVQYEAHIDKDGQDLEIVVTSEGKMLRKGEDVAD